MSENKFKTAADIDAAVHLSSLLHQRYAEFTETLLPTLLKLFVFPKQEKEDEKTSRLVKQRMMLRFVTELILLGVYNDLGVVLQLLKDIVSPCSPPLSLSRSRRLTSTTFSFFISPLQIHSEKDPLVVLTLVSSFAKKYSEELTGIEPRNIGGNERVCRLFFSCLSRWITNAPLVS